jgi:hypothetical protein
MLALEYRDRPNELTAPFGVALHCREDREARRHSRCHDGRCATIEMLHRDGLSSASGLALIGHQWDLCYSKALVGGVCNESGP